MSENTPTYGEAIMNAVSKEAKAVLAAEYLRLIIHAQAVTT